MKQLFTLLFSITLLGNSLAQEKTKFEELSALIEQEFNKSSPSITSNNGTVSFFLRFDSLNHFVLLDSSAYYPKEVFSFNKFLKEYDLKTGILSQNPLFSDSSEIYMLTTFLDNEIQRIRFTNISSLSENNNTMLGGTYFVTPQPRGGLRNLLNYIVTNIKNKNLEHHFSTVDTAWLSFIVADDGSMIDVKVNGISNIDRTRRFREMDTCYTTW